MRYLTSLVLLTTTVSWACCPAMPPGVVVQIADQEVLIVYDEANGVEHFVRSASFARDVQEQEDAADFGFLVPTPTQPELGEADAAVFARLGEAIKPEERHVTKTRLAPTCLCLAPFVMTMDAAAPRGAGATAVDFVPSVQVLDQTQVAGYDAAVLKANDPQALEDWLEEHGYSPRSDLQEWVKPYVKEGWIVTAFKYSEQPDDTRVVAKSVRMSFKTDRPLFPYRVPKDQIAPEGFGNLLRVFYVGVGRVQGKLGADAKAWNAELKYAQVVKDLAGLLAGAIPASYTPGEGVRLNAFEDHTWPSGTEDLYFSPDPDQSPFEQPAIVIVERKEVPLPIDIPLVILAGVAFWWWRRKRLAGR